MTAFTPANEADPSLADIARSLNGLHECVHVQFRQQEQWNAEATSKRHEMASSLAGLQGSMSVVQTEVGEVKAAQGIDSGRITRLAVSVGAEKPVKGGPRVRRGIGSWPGWKAAGAGLAVVGGAVTLFQVLSPAFVAFCVQLYASLMAAH